MSHRHFEEETPTQREIDRAVELVRGQRAGLLSSVPGPGETYPLCTVVTYALQERSLIVLLNQLGEQVTNIRRDGRCSLTVVEEVGVPLQHRSLVLLSGFCTQLTSPEAVARAAMSYSTVHPQDTYELGMTHSGLWMIEVHEIRYVGGFGHLSRLTIGEWNEGD